MMASEKIISQKTEVVSEIKSNIESANAVVFFDYRGLTVGEMGELRKTLKENDASLKIYKNTLTQRAVDELKLDLNDTLLGPSAMAYGSDIIAPIKVVSDFAKKFDSLEIKGGIIEGEVSTLEALKSIAAIPSREGLLTMLAGGLIGVVRDLSIGLNMVAEQKEN